jgi:hypothetical protein
MSTGKNRSEKEYGEHTGKPPRWKGSAEHQPGKVRMHNERQVTYRELAGDLSGLWTHRTKGKGKGGGAAGAGRGKCARQWPDDARSGRVLRECKEGEGYGMGWVDG